MKYLPRPLRKQWVEVGKAGRVENLLVVLVDWFEGFEEWHFQKHGGSTRAFVWDMRGGYRFLSEAETFDLARQASYILTLCYDIESTRRVLPWHHGGGDFIVKTTAPGVEVRLITVRGYEPIGDSSNEKPLRALCSFCIETLTKMRLDKREGMGESTWADAFVVEAALKGFCDGLETKKAQDEMKGIDIEDVLQALRSLSFEELRSLIRGQPADTKKYDLSDYGVVLRHLGRHSEEIYDAIRSLKGWRAGPGC